jgi:hypothetical protein
MIIALEYDHRKRFSRAARFSCHPPEKELVVGRQMLTKVLNYVVETFPLRPN